MKKSWIAFACLFYLPLFAGSPEETLIAGSPEETLIAGSSNHPECKEEDLCELPATCPAKKPVLKAVRPKGMERKTKPCETECAKPCVNPCEPRKEKKKESICGEPCVPFCPIEETLPNRKITPPIIPNVSCGWNIEISADFIWWTTFIDNLPFALTNIVDGGTFVPFGTDVPRGSVAYPNFKFEPGFKVGLGGSLGHDGWDLFANYTWLRNGSDLVEHLDGTSGEG